MNPGVLAQAEVLRLRLVGPAAAGFSLRVVVGTGAIDTDNSNDPPFTLIELIGTVAQLTAAPHVCYQENPVSKE